MESVARLSSAERRELFGETAARKSELCRKLPLIVEWPTAVIQRTL